MTGRRIYRLGVALVDLGRALQFASMFLPSSPRCRHVPGLICLVCRRERARRERVTS